MLSFDARIISTLLILACGNLLVVTQKSQLRLLRFALERARINVINLLLICCRVSTDFSSARDLSSQMQTEYLLPFYTISRKRLGSAR